MERQLSSIERRLAEITKGFFETKLGLRPQRVNVLEEEGGALIVIRVAGFMSKAEAALAGHPEDQKALGEYYTRILERLSPMLRVVVEDVVERPLLGCRTVLELSRDECLYLLTLGARERSGSVSIQSTGDE